MVNAFWLEVNGLTVDEYFDLPGEGHIILNKQRILSISGDWTCPGCGQGYFAHHHSFAFESDKRGKQTSKVIEEIMTCHTETSRL